MYTLETALDKIAELEMKLSELEVEYGQVKWHESYLKKAIDKHGIKIDYDEEL